MEKLNVLVLFGGQSSEYEVSLVSASNVLNMLNKEKYNVIMVGITKEGKWLRYEGSYDDIKQGVWEKGRVSKVYMTPDSTIGLFEIKDGKESVIPIDVVFPVLHGKWGEDGTVQGLCALAKIPVVGAGLLASALCMDKVYAKVMFKELGIPQADWLTVYKEELPDMDRVIEKIEAKFKYPVFIKPSNAGSSMGIGKSHNREELKAHLWEASKHDRKILVEESINGREIECAVLGNTKPVCSCPGEIVSSKEFYDYEAKYFSDSKLIIPADITDEVAKKIVNFAKIAYLGLDLRGMSRVDFFVHKETNEVFLNEINTIPGFTNTSMYPMLMGQSGYENEKLADRLIELAIEEFSGIYEA